MPFLWIGDTVASLQHCGWSPLAKEMLKIRERDGEISLDTCLRSLIGIPSSPALFLWSRSFSNLHTYSIISSSKSAPCPPINSVSTRSNKSKIHMIGLQTQQYPKGNKYAYVTWKADLKLFLHPSHMPHQHHAVEHAEFAAVSLYISSLLCYP